MQLMGKAHEFGADLVGIADVEILKKSPSYNIQGKLDNYHGVGTISQEGEEHKEVVWPENAKTAIITAIKHLEDKPELDWWQDGLSGKTLGNMLLMSINAKMKRWVEEQGRVAYRLPYHIENGGIYLKDAAVLAGLGCIGKNNMLVTPEFGPRVRLRGMLIDDLLPTTGPVDFDPCEDCDLPCREACPQKAFKKNIYQDKDYGVSQLPGRSGVFDRHTCDIQMKIDLDNHEPIEVEDQDEPGKLARYCRDCEMSCPVGKMQSSQNGKIY